MEREWSGSEIILGMGNLIMGYVSFPSISFVDVNRGREKKNVSENGCKIVSSEKINFQYSIEIFDSYLTSLVLDFR